MLAHCLAPLALTSLGLAPLQTPTPPTCLGSASQHNWECPDCSFVFVSYGILPGGCPTGCAWTAQGEVGCHVDGVYGTYSFSDAATLTCTNGHRLTLPCIGTPGGKFVTIYFGCTKWGCPE